MFDVSITMIRKYKAGINFPKSEPLLHMADVFDVSVDWLVGRRPVREVAKGKNDKPR
jgi:transcriptional regulator with XRE-family HTH domain